MRQHAQFWIPVALIAFLLLAIPLDSKGLRDLLHLGVFGGCGYLVWCVLGKSDCRWKNLQKWSFVTVAVVLNPIAPPRFTVEGWRGVEFITSILLAIVGFDWPRLMHRRARWVRVRSRWKWTGSVALAKKAARFTDQEIDQLVAQWRGEGPMSPPASTVPFWRNANTAHGWRSMDIPHLKFLYGFLKLAEKEHRRELRRMRSFLTRQKVPPSTIREMIQSVSPWAGDWPEANYIKLREIRKILGDA